jgi:pimeloyl-ACP methyl ester carboxylesterase
MKLVLLPGFDGTGQLFKPLLKQFTSNIEPVVMSYPNDKFMTYKELCEYIKPKLPNEPFFILGESFGGPLAVMLSNLSSNHVKGLILSVTFASDPKPVISKLIRPIVSPRFFSYKIPSWFIKRFLLGGRQNTELINQVKILNKLLSPETIFSRLEEIVDVDVTSEVQRLNLPILYQRASKDWLVRKYSMDQFIHYANNISTVTFNAPHLLLQTFPRESAEGIEEFIKKHFK